VRVRLLEARATRSARGRMARTNLSVAIIADVVVVVNSVVTVARGVVGLRQPLR
jgi:hypothetical protein